VHFVGLIKNSDTQRGKMGSQHPCKEHTSRCMNKDGKKCVKCHIYHERKVNTWVRERTKDVDGTKQIKRCKWIWAGYIRISHIATKGNNLEEDRRQQGNEIKKYWKRDSAREADLERAGWSLCPQMGHHGHRWCNKNLL